MAVFYGIHRIDRIAMRFHGIRGILSVPRNPSVEFFQFHGIRGNWWNLAAHFHGMPWNFYITSGSTILPSFFMETTAFTKNSVRILHGSIPRNSTMIPWHIYRRVAGQEDGFNEEMYMRLTMMMMHSSCCHSSINFSMSIDGKSLSAILYLTKRPLS